MHDLFKIFLEGNFYSTIIRVSTPIIFAALGALIASSAGTPNVALEGIMLFAAFFGTLSSAYSGSLLIGLLAGIGAGLSLSCLLAMFSIKFKANIILTAIAINILSSGGTAFLLSSITLDKGGTFSLQSREFPKIHLDFLEKLPFISEIFNDQNLLVWLAFGSPFIVWLILKKSPLGYHLRAVGENPEAANSVGIDVNKVKTTAIILSGFFASLGGIYLSMGYVSWFTRDMTGGRGWIALAAQALGGKSTIGVTLSALLFGTGESLSYSLQIFEMPSEIIQSIPFIITIIVFLIYVSLNKDDII